MPNLIDWMLHNWNKSVAKAGKSVWYTQHMLGKKLLKLQPKLQSYNQETCSTLHSSGKKQSCQGFVRVNVSSKNETKLQCCSQRVNM